MAEVIGPRTNRGWRAVVALVAAACLLAPAVASDDVVVLKSGRELRGRVVSDADHRVELDDAERGRVVLPRHLVRTVVRADAPPGLMAPLWLDGPDGEMPKTWIRFAAPADGEPGALSIGVGRFFHEPTRTTLFLVGAVHVADPAYYARLQDLLDSCDVVLFEGVGSRPGDPEPTAEQVARFDVLFQLQVKLQQILGFQGQKEGLDYRRPFWKRADVTLHDLAARMEERKVALPTDHPLVQVLLKIALGTLDSGQVGADPLVQRLAKRQAAAVMANADQMLGGALGGLQETLVDWRNDAALATLDREVAEGKPGRWLALFYGAAHLPDFATKLCARGFEFQAADFLPAWRLD